MIVGAVSCGRRFVVEPTLWYLYPVSNGTWERDVHGEFGRPCCVASSIIVRCGTVRILVRDRGASGGGEANRGRTVFPIALILLRSNIQKVFWPESL